MPASAAAALPAPPDIIRAARAELAVTDLARARWFWVDMLGFVVAHETREALYLRAYDEFTHHSLVLRQRDVAGSICIGYRVRTPGDLDAAERFFGELGCPTNRVGPGEIRGLGEAVRVTDPLGFTVEFLHEIDRAERYLQRYDLRRGAEPARMDHFNIVVPDMAAAYRHYESLGFGCSETIEDETELYAAWMYRKPTVHDVAFTGGAGPRLHHVAFFVHESHQVLRACDIFGSLGEQAHIERGPGRHGVSNAFYVYIRDPDNHRLELYTSDYWTGDPDHETYRWSVHDDRRRDFWGNPVVESWYKEATTVLDLAGRPMPTSESRIDEAAVTVGPDGFTVAPLAR